MVLRLRGDTQLFVKTLIGRPFLLTLSNQTPLITQRPRFKIGREFHMQQEERQALWLILEMMLHKSKSMFPTSTFVLETWTLVYFCYIYLNNLEQKYTKVHVSNTKVDVGNMDFDLCNIISRINHNACRSSCCIWNSLPILNLGLCVIKGVWLLNVRRNGLPIKVLTKSCVSPLSLRTKWIIDSFWML